MEFRDAVQIGNIAEINKHLCTSTPVITIEDINKSPICGYLYLVSHKFQVIHNNKTLTPLQILGHKYEKMVRNSDIHWINCLPQLQLGIVAQFSHSNPITLEFCLSKSESKYHYNIHPTTEECFDICVKYKYNFNKSPHYHEVLMHLEAYELLEKLLLWNDKKYAISRIKLMNKHFSRLLQIHRSK